MRDDKVEILQNVQATELSDEVVGSIMGVTRQSVHGWRKSEGQRSHYTVAQVHRMIQDKKEATAEMSSRFLEVVTNLI